MTPETPPPPSAIGNIEPASARFYHVRDHLLRGVERWDLVCPGLPRDARSEALRCGCDEYALTERTYRYERAAEACRASVARLHDKHYALAYRHALEWAHENRYYAFIFGKRDRLAAVGPEGFLVHAAWSNEPTGWRVFTAFRCEYGGAEYACNNKIFLDRAIRKWRDKTSKPGRST